MARGDGVVPGFAAGKHLSVGSLELADGDLSGLSVALGLVVADAAERMGVPDTGVKWPNDVLSGGRKLAGILVETTRHPSGCMAVVAGVGMNMRMPESMSTDIGQSWTDLDTASRHPPPRKTAVACLLESVLIGLDLFSQQGFAPFRSRWNERDVMRARRVVLHTGHGQTEGVAEGVDENGALLLCVDGVTERVITGDVSLRALP